MKHATTFSRLAAGPVVVVKSVAAHRAEGTVERITRLVVSAR